MLVETLDHGKHVLRRFKNFAKTCRALGETPYIVFDSETKPKHRHPNKAMLINFRYTIKVFSICFDRGESYSFPTNHFDPNYPTIEEWHEVLLKESLYADDVVAVAHNWNYDGMGIISNLGIRIPKNIWDSMIGCWAASEYLEKSLKQRAFRYGRVLRDTKTVNFSDLTELAEYAEQDVVATEEIYLYQTTGELKRRRVFVYVDANGELVHVGNPLPQKPTVPKDEILRPHAKDWLEFVELPVLKSTLRAQTRGFPFNIPTLRKIRDKVKVELKTSLATLFSISGEVFNPNSPPQIAKVAKRLGIRNDSKTIKGGTSFGVKALVKIQNSHPFITALMRYKAVSKLQSVYVGSRSVDWSAFDFKTNEDSGLEYYVNPDTGCIHCSIATVGAVTGRASCSNPNLQQIPSRKDEFGIKSCFVANAFFPSEGVFFIGGREFARNKFSKAKRRLLIILDYAQLEIRVMCLLCGDPEMTRILRDPAGDIHTNTANRFKVARDPSAKNLNFLMLYGGKEYALSEQLNFLGVPTTPEQCAIFRQQYDHVYYRVHEYREELLVTHQRHGHVELFCGDYRHRTLPDVNWHNDWEKHKAETTLSNNVVQGSGQDFLKAAIIRADYRCYNPDSAVLARALHPKSSKTLPIIKDYVPRLERYRRTLKLAQCEYLLQVHDEVAFSVDYHAAEECLNILGDIMSWRHFMPSRIPYRIPLVAEGGVGENWKAAKSKNDHLFHAKIGFGQPLDN